MVRAKFRVTSIRRISSQTTKKDAEGQTVKDSKGYAIYEATELQTIELSPVYSNGDPAHENTKFWEASPSGRIELGTINPAAAQQFHLGQEFYIDFTPATAP